MLWSVCPMACRATVRCDAVLLLCVLCCAVPCHAVWRGVAVLSCHRMAVLCCAVLRCVVLWYAMLLLWRGVGGA
eukprot:COSAG02_NODE_28501_length_588_cov_0.957055_2_plen_73_part_01